MGLRNCSTRAWREISASTARCARLQRTRPISTASPPRQSTSYPPPNFLSFDPPGSDGDIPSADVAADTFAPHIPTPRSSFAPPPDAFSTFGANPSLLAKYLEHPPQPLTLPALLSLSPSTQLECGRRIVKPTEEELLRSANFTRHELPTLLARRVGSFRNLPFIVGSNPYIQRIARLYAESFETIATLGPIMNSEDNQQFTLMLEQLVTDHSQNIPTLARGFLECKKYMDPQAVSAFLDAAIHSRIGIRLIAEQHLSLSMSADSGSATPAATSASSSSNNSQALPSSIRSSQSPTSVGVIDLALKPANLIRTCASFVHDLCEGTLGCSPELWLEGDVEATYVGVPVHLEYVITEVLKNSYRATAERHGKRKEGSGAPRSQVAALPPVKVTIAKSAHHLSIRIRDQGGGISPRNLPHVFSYAFTTAGEDPAGDDGGGASPEEEGPYAMQSSQIGGADADALGALGGAAAAGLSTGLGTLAGLGYGLPMARIYATYFGAGSGGSALEIISLYGHGCDTYIKLPSNVLAFS